MTETVGRWDTAYEWKAVTLLSLAFGLVGLDRWIITPLFPSIMKDLHLDYGQIGALAGILAVCWGFAAILMGGVADRIGRRKVMIPAIVIFSLLSGLSGVAASFGMLMLLRGIMGCTEGAFTPASVAATAEASQPKRRGLNQGFQLSLFALLGLGLGPIIATQLLKVVPSWRYVFMLVAIPGFILAILMYFVIREPSREVAAAHAHGGRWIDAVRNHNVIVSIVGVLCAMCGIFVIGAMMPSYLIDFLKLTPPQMGFVMSAIGFGGFLGEFLVPGLSDSLGRKTMAIAAFVGGAILLKLFQMTGPDPMTLFILLFFVGFCCLGLLSLFTGPVPTEAVNPVLIASAIGLVSGTGEIFGGGIAPVIGGWIAQHHGIQHVLDLALGGLVAGIVVSLFIKESAPRKLAAATLKVSGAARQA
ncbi:MAG: MFS transporter [Caulobacteraceae bacterium]